MKFVTKCIAVMFGLGVLAGQEADGAGQQLQVVGDPVIGLAQQHLGMRT